MEDVAKRRGGDEWKMYRTWNVKMEVVEMRRGRNGEWMEKEDGICRVEGRWKL
jgi:hypothetical protein